MAVAQQGQGGRQAVMDGLSANSEGLGSFVDVRDAEGNSVLFRLEQVERNRVGVVRLQELAALSLKALALGAELLAGGVGFGDAAGQCLPEEPLCAFKQRRRELHALVELGDPLFDGGYVEGLLGAAGALLMPSQTHEVGVGDTATVRGHVDDEPATALPTEDRRLQVVRVASALLTDAVASEDVLDSLPYDRVNQWVVLAGVDSAPPANVALEVGVPQQVVEQGVSDRSTGPLGAGERAHPSGVELRSHRDKRPLARGKCLERPAHQLSALWVDDHRPHLSAQLIKLSDIAVAERCSARRAARSCLLAHPLDHFSREVARVELRDCAHDPVQQHAARGLVDVLRAGDERCTGLLDGDVDLDVIDSVAGQAVDLVHDDVADALVLGKELQHPL